jgi:hypothetical protein
MLHKALADACRKGTVQRNVAGLADAPRAKRRSAMQVWNAEQLRQFLAEIETHRLAPAFYVSANTGMRRGEVLGLHWRDVDFDTSRLSVHQAVLNVAYEKRLGDVKTETGRRTIDLDPRTIDVLHAWRQDQREEQQLTGRRASSMWVTARLRGDPSAHRRGLHGPLKRVRRLQQSPPPPHLPTRRLIRSAKEGTPMPNLPKQTRPTNTLAIRQAWASEHAAAHEARTRGDSLEEWRHLERAHILSQPLAGAHVRTHLAMLGYGIRHRDRREVAGQLARLLVAGPGSAIGRYPLGNTGGANVNAVTPMPLPANLRALLSGDGRVAS